ncbi:hypothetical protein GCM10008967_25950 [Bacillus carboniphilus]|uniref:SPOR domain-containing protein n=1 Tax=Bacillus carboniphilus TaxID=86663 RepID=A0ABP3G2R7_9BACI
MREEPNKDGQIKIMLNDKQTSYKEERKTQAKDLLENVKLETAATSEEADADFDWILPEVEPEPKTFKQATGIKQKGGRKKTSPSSRNVFHTFGSLIFSIAFAVGLGIAFGLILLKFISVEEAPAVVQANNPTPQTEQPSNNGSLGSALLPSFTSYVIQGGIFSSKESANTLVGQLNEKSIPSEVVLMEDGNYYVFLGLASNEQEAKRIAEIYKGQGVEVYAKALTLNEMTIEQLDSTSAAVFNQGATIMPTLVDVAGKVALGQSVPQDTLSTITGVANSFNEVTVQEPIVQTVTQIILQSSGALQNYAQTNNMSQANAIQDALLSYIKLNIEK